jgi:hypothetical protein
MTPLREVTAELARDAALYVLLRERGAGLIMTDELVRQMQHDRELTGTWISTMRTGHLDATAVTLVREVRP